MNLKSFAKASRQMLNRKALRRQQGQLLQGDPELGREEREEVSREDCYAEESCP